MALDQERKGPHRLPVCSFAGSGYVNDECDRESDGYMWVFLMTSPISRAAGVQMAQGSRPVAAADWISCDFFRVTTKKLNSRSTKVKTYTDEGFHLSILPESPLPPVLSVLDQKHPGPVTTRTR